MDKIISATTARRDLFRVLADVRTGQSYTITWRGKPVARMLPPIHADETRRIARQALMERLENQPAAALAAGRATNSMSEVGESRSRRRSTV